jgi:hypothetical protein
MCLKRSCVPEHMRCLQHRTHQLAVSGCETQLMACAMLFRKPCSITSLPRIMGMDALAMQEGLDAMIGAMSPGTQHGYLFSG